MKQDEETPLEAIKPVTCSAMLTLTTTDIPLTPTSPPEILRKVIFTPPDTKKSSLPDLPFENEREKKELETKKDEMVSCYKWEENWSVDGYIKQHCDYIDREDLFMLLCFERFCRSHSTPLSKGMLLELSGGPSIYNLITIAPYVQGIFFSDFLPQNLQHVRAFVNGMNEEFLVPYYRTVSDIRGASEQVIEQAIKENLTLDEFHKLLSSSTSETRKRKKETKSLQVQENNSEFLKLEAAEVRKKLNEGGFYSINLLQPQSLKKHSFSSTTTTTTTTTTPAVCKGMMEGKPISVVAMHFVCEAIVDSISKFQGVLRNALEYVPIGTYIMFTMLENASVWEMDIAGTLMECLPVNETVVTQVLEEAGFRDIHFSHCGGIDARFNSYDAIMFFSAQRNSIPTPVSS